MATKKSNDPAGAQGSDAHAFIVHRREKSTKKSVLLGDKVANWVITVGGLLVIVAVITIMLFLISVAMPLAGSGEVREHRVHKLATGKVVAWLNADEYTTVGIRVAADGAVSAFHIPTGTFISSDQLDFAEAATAVAGVVTLDQVAFGFADGTVRFGTFGFDIRVVTPAMLPSGRDPLTERDSMAVGTVFREMPTGDFRAVAPAWKLDPPQQISAYPIVALDYRIGGTVERPTRSFVTVDAAGVARVSRAVVQRNLMTGAETVRVTSSTLPTLPEGTVVTRVLMSSAADRVIVATDQGTLYRYDVRDFNAPILAETTRAFDSTSRSPRWISSTRSTRWWSAAPTGRWTCSSASSSAPADTTDGYQLVRTRSHENQGRRSSASRSPSARRRWPPSARTAACGCATPPRTARCSSSSGRAIRLPPRR
jgi:phosphate transport system permease protein